MKCYQWTKGAYTCPIVITENDFNKLPADHQSFYKTVEAVKPTYRLIPLGGGKYNLYFIEENTLKAIGSTQIASESK